MLETHFIPFLSNEESVIKNYLLYEDNQVETDMTERIISPYIENLANCSNYRHILGFVFQS